jgi:hypothetical protein
VIFFTPCNGSLSGLERCGSRAGHLSVFATANRTRAQRAAVVAELAMDASPLETHGAATAPGAAQGTVMWQGSIAEMSRAAHVLSAEYLVRTAAASATPWRIESSPEEGDHDALPLPRVWVPLVPGHYKRSTPWWRRGSTVVLMVKLLALACVVSVVASPRGRRVAGHVRGTWVQPLRDRIRPLREALFRRVAAWLLAHGGTSLEVLDGVARRD